MGNNKNKTKTAAAGDSKKKKIIDKETKKAADVTAICRYCKDVKGSFPEVQTHQIKCDYNKPTAKGPKASGPTKGRKDKKQQK